MKFPKEVFAKLKNREIYGDKDKPCLRKLKTQRNTPIYMAASNNIIQNYSNARGAIFFFRSPQWNQWGHLRTYSEMSPISVSTPNGRSVPEPSPENAERTLSSNVVSGHIPPTNQEDSAQKSLLSISLDARAKIWMSRDLRVFLIRNTPTRAAQSRLRCGGIKEVGEFPIRNHCIRYSQF